MPPNRPIKFVASGFPSPADDFAEHALDLNKFIVQDTSATFFLRNQSSANRVYGLCVGDILVVDRSLKPCRGSLSVLILDDEFKIRNYQQMQKLLSIENLDAEFWGVITAIIRKL